jgi:hypothetical protein
MIINGEDFEDLKTGDSGIFTNCISIGVLHSVQEIAGAATILGGSCHFLYPIV